LCVAFKPSLKGKTLGSARWIAIATRSTLTQSPVLKMYALGASSFEYPVIENKELSALVFNPVCPQLLLGLSCQGSTPQLYIFFIDLPSDANIKSSTKPTLQLIQTLFYHPRGDMFSTSHPETYTPSQGESVTYKTGSLVFNNNGFVLVVSLVSDKEYLTNCKNVIIRPFDLQLYRALHPCSDLMF